jgi:hypothetical protein
VQELIGIAWDLLDQEQVLLELSVEFIRFVRLCQFLSHGADNFCQRKGLARHLHDPGGSPRSVKILESHGHFPAIVADGLFGPKQTFYYLPRPELKELEEIFRPKVLAMLKRALRACR